ncbi:hypothetical protein GN956_G3161 [Arapaima gigas]
MYSGKTWRRKRRKDYVFSVIKSSVLKGDTADSDLRNSFNHNCCFKQFYLDLWQVELKLEGEEETKRVAAEKRGYTAFTNPGDAGKKEWWCVLPSHSFLNRAQWTVWSFWWECEELWEPLLESVLKQVGAQATYRLLFLQTMSRHGDEGTPGPHRKQSKGVALSLQLEGKTVNEGS